MADAKLTALTAASALAGEDLFYISQGGVSKRATHTQLLTLVGTEYVPLAGGTMTGALTIASGTLTASAPALNITQTWNEGATTFTALSVAVTNTASGGGYLADFRVGGTMQFSVDRGGGMYWGAASGGAADANYVYTKSLALTNGSTRYAVDALLTRDAAATLAQRNGTTAQTLRVYGTSVDGSNYQYMQLSANGTTGVTISAVGLGTPTANQDITLTPGGTGNNILSAGHLFVKVNNARIEVSSAGAYQFSAGTAGQTGADIAFRRSAIGVVDVDSGTANAYRDLKLRNLLAGGGNGSYVQTPSMTVTNLAAAGTAGAGARAFVTDATATTFLSTVAGGGANKVPVVSDGTNWLIG